MRSPERGIALVLVLVILPLVAIIMVQLHFETTIGTRLASNVLANQQFKFAIAARLRHIRKKLVRDLVEDEKNSQEQGGSADHYSDDWGPDVEGGNTAQVVRKGDEEYGDDVELYTDVIDEQGKFNLNLLRHSDPQRRQRAQDTLRNLLDFFRDSRFGDLGENDYDIDGAESQELLEAILKFVRGEERDQRTPKSELPQPTGEMKQGLFTVDDLVFCHRLFIEKRLLEKFTDVGSGQVLPSLSEVLTVYGDGKVNANTAPIAVLRAMFKEPEGHEIVAAEILKGRGGFLNTPEDQEERRNKAEERKQAEEDGDEEALEQLNGGFMSTNDILQIEGMNEAGFLRRNDLDVARDFTTRTNFFTVIVTAKRENFMRQQRMVVERHSKGTITWETEVRAADFSSLPEGIPGVDSGESGQPE
jgi:type II secretory pathway component PulK